MDKRNLLILPVLLWILLFYFLPLCIILVHSVFEPSLIGLPSFENVTLHNYFVIFADDRVLRVLLQSLLMSTLTTIVCVIVGYPLAFAISIQDDALKEWLYFLATLPMFINYINRLFSLRIAFTDNILTNAVFGTPNPLSDYLYSNYSTVAGLVYGSMFFFIVPSFTYLDRITNDIVGAARSLGAGRFAIMWRIVLPLSYRGVLTGGVLVFITSFGDYLAPQILGGDKTLSFGKLIFDKYAGQILDWPGGAALGMLVVFLVLAVSLAVRRSPFLSSFIGR